MPLFDDAGNIPAAQITNPARTVGDAAGTMNQIIRWHYEPDHR